MSTTSWVAGVVIIIAIIGGIWWYTANPAPAPATTTGDTSGTLTGTVEAGTDAGQPDTGVLVGGDAAVTVDTPKTVTVTYNGTSFSPESVTIKKGDTVKFVNSASGNMWVAVDEHPTHTEYDNTSRATHCASGYTGPTPFDQCASGASYSFTFNTAGTANYHNHAAAAARGRVMVQ